jgi:hypothetical protein
MKKVLIEAGLTGIGKFELGQKCRTRRHSIQDITEVLEIWKAKGYVQMFKVQKPHAKRPIETWRATELIRNVRA